MGGTALFSAANHPEVISMLLAHNANLHAAIKSKHNKSVLDHYVSIGCIDGVYVLLNSGCNIEQVDTNGETALHYAAKEKYVDVAQLLLSRGIDPDIQTATQESALQIGTRTKNLELIRVMLRHGANLEIKDSQQKTALFIAASANDENLVSYWKEAPTSTPNVLWEELLCI